MMTSGQAPNGHAGPVLCVTLHSSGTLHSCRTKLTGSGAAKMSGSYAKSKKCPAAMLSASERAQPDGRRGRPTTPAPPRQRAEPAPLPSRDVRQSQFSNGVDTRHPGDETAGRCAIRGARDRPGPARGAHGRWPADRGRRCAGRVPRPTGGGPRSPARTRPAVAARDAPPPRAAAAACPAIGRP